MGGCWGLQLPDVQTWKSIGTYLLVEFLRILLVIQNSRGVAGAAPHVQNMNQDQNTWLLECLLKDS